MPTIREIQLFELQMLKDIAKVCDENKITYLLASGTLLGAARHGGFIPWDDDIDLYMPLKDYKRFLKIGQKCLGDKYFVQNYKTDKNYGEMWTQIRANGTTSMPKSCYKYNIHFGMCLDIFPMVGASSNEKKREKQDKALEFNRVLLHDSYAKAVGENISPKLKLLYLIPRGIRRFICKLNEHRYLIDPNKTESWKSVWFSLNVPMYQHELLNNYDKIKFEDDYFNTFKNYDLYLTDLYGEYMTPPPIEERGGHTDELGEIIFDLHKDYSDYQRQLFNDNNS